MKAVLTKKDEKFLEMSLNAPMWKVILNIGTPLALYQALNMLFTILDTMMASHISKESVSAVAYLSQINHLLSAVGGGLAVGAGIMISRAFGEGNLELVRKRVSTLYMICLTVGLAMMLAILPFTRQFLLMAGTPETLIEVGGRYFQLQLLVMVVTFLNNVYIAVERARGNSSRIFRLNLLVILIKLSLTAFFIYILNGDLLMVALASLISQVTLLAFAFKNSLGGDDTFSFRLQAVTLRGNVAAPMVYHSVPVITEKALFAFGKTIVNSMCTVYGDLMVGAMGVSNNLGGITTNPQNGYQEGAAAIISQNLGAGKFQRVLDAFTSVLWINVILGAVISGLELWQLDLLASLFDSGSKEFHDMIMLVYRYEALGAVPLGINASVMALLYGLGKTRITLILNLARVFAFRIPVFWFLQNFTNFGEASVGLVMMISNMSVAVCAIIAAYFVIRGYRKDYGLGDTVKFSLWPRKSGAVS
ncbi:MAG: MATE family efflux transporter [Lachnospiraceae bacterium]|nr:MATE family efflux transporter [Lachnospiraceae bacterium]